MNAENEYRVIAVNRDDAHRFSKPAVDEVVLIAGLGIAGDAHAGTTVQHRSRVARDPSQPNLRQVHLIHSELFDELQGAGFTVGPGELGENITTHGLDVLSLPTGTRLHLGDEAVIEVTGLRNPCRLINDFTPGLMKQVLGHAPDGSLERKTGVMAVVLVGGAVRAGDALAVELPSGESMPLAPV